MVIQGAAEDQLEFKFKLSLFGQTEEPQGDRREQMKTKMRLKEMSQFWSSVQYQQLQGPEGSKNLKTTSKRKKLGDADDSCFQSKIQKLVRTEQDF